MSLWSRIANVFRQDRLNRGIDEELASHLEEALESGRDPGEVRRAFGSPLRIREASRDARLHPFLDSLRADAIFGLRQLRKNWLTSAAAILSLALATGACTTAFRIVDALLLRPLPVKDSGRLYDVSRDEIGFDGKPGNFDGWAYPDFQLMRVAAGNQADLIAVSYAEPAELSYKGDEDIERARVQYVSGSMFSFFGLRPAVGRLLAKDDDRAPGADPCAVLSYGYWTSRFGRDPGIVGRTFHLGNRVYTIVGVVDKPFSGTEPGAVVDIFVPTMMNPAVQRRDSTWHRILAIVPPGVDLEALRQKLDATSLAFERERAKGFMGMSQESIDAYLKQKVVIDPAPSGVSGLQSEARRPLSVLSVLVVLVLLIACANVANLMTAQASARAREMAVRVSLGGGRWRLVQLVLLQSAWLGLFATLLGAFFAWWSGPFVIGLINPPDNPAQLRLPSDWRLLGFSLLLALGVTLLFGLLPALRASSIRPVSALKGGENPHARHRTMYALIGLQVAFSFVVLFLTALFVSTFERLSHQPTGFSSDRLLVLDVSAKSPQSVEIWRQLEDRLRAVPGVRDAALADQALLGGYSWNNFVSINGAPPNAILSYMRAVSPGWLETMRIPLLSGRNFLPADTSPGVAVVNETFADTYFDGQNPVGKSFEIAMDEGPRIRYQIVALVGDVRYRNLREPILPQFYVPFRSVQANGAPGKADGATVLVRASSTNLRTLAHILRQEVPLTRSEFHVSRIRTQQEIDESHTVRERLLATLAIFFAAVALLLAAVGLYGVLHYSVLQRRREIGIRIAIGAQSASIVRLITWRIFLVILLGAICGVGLGLASARFVESLIYQVHPTDPRMLALPSLALAAGALFAALPAIFRALRIDPASLLRSE